MYSGSISLARHKVERYVIVAQVSSFFCILPLILADLALWMCTSCGQSEFDQALRRSQVIQEVLHCWCELAASQGIGCDDRLSRLLIFHRQAFQVIDQVLGLQGNLLYGSNMVRRAAAWCELGNTGLMLK